MYVLNWLGKSIFFWSQRRGFCTGGNLAKVRGRGQRSWRLGPGPRAPLGLYECKKSLFRAGAQKSTVRSRSTSSAYCVKERGTVKAKCVLIWRVLVTDGPKQGQQMYTTCTVYLTDMPLNMLLQGMSLIIHLTPGYESASCLLVQLKKLLYWSWQRIQCSISRITHYIGVVKH